MCIEGKVKKNKQNKVKGRLSLDGHVKRCFLLHD